MKRMACVITNLSRLMDRVAGFCMVAVMLIVVANIILRGLFNRPILGAYEYVVFITAVMIGLTLAYCAVQNGHIAVSFVMDKFSSKIQASVEALVNTVGVLFWGVCAWQMAKYGRSVAESGMVSSTTQIPFHPVIYLVAFGITALSLVLFFRAVESFIRAALGK